MSSLLYHFKNELSSKIGMIPQNHCDQFARRTLNRSVSTISYELHRLRDQPYSATAAQNQTTASHSAGKKKLT